MDGDSNEFGQRVVDAFGPDFARALLQILELPDEPRSDLIARMSANPFFTNPKFKANTYTLFTHTYSTGDLPFLTKMLVTMERAPRLRQKTVEQLRQALD